MKLQGDEVKLGALTQIPSQQKPPSFPGVGTRLISMFEVVILGCLVARNKGVGAIGWGVIRTLTFTTVGRPRYNVYTEKQQSRKRFLSSTLTSVGALTSKIYVAYGSAVNKKLPLLRLFVSINIFLR